MCLRQHQNLSIVILRMKAEALCARISQCSDTDVFIAQNGGQPPAGGRFLSFPLDAAIKYHPCDDFGPFKITPTIRFIKQMGDVATKSWHAR